MRDIIAEHLAQQKEEDEDAPIPVRSDPLLKSFVGRVNEPAEMPDWLEMDYLYGRPKPKKPRRRGGGNQGPR